MTTKSGSSDLTITSGLGCGFIILALGACWFGSRILARWESGASVECTTAGGEWVVERDKDGDVDAAYCRKGKP